MSPVEEVKRPAGKSGFRQSRIGNAIAWCELPAWNRRLCGRFGHHASKHL